MPTLGKESACNAGNPISIPESGRSPGEGNGCPLQYFFLKVYGQRSLVGYSPWGLKELDMTEQLSTQRANHSNADSLEHLNGYALLPWWEWGNNSAAQGAHKQRRTTSWSPRQAPRKWFATHFVVMLRYRTFCDFFSFPWFNLCLCFWKWIFQASTCELAENFKVNKIGYKKA